MRVASNAQLPPTSDAPKLICRATGLVPVPTSLGWACRPSLAETGILAVAATYEYPRFLALSPAGASPRRLLASTDHGRYGRRFGLF